MTQGTTTRKQCAHCPWRKDVNAAKDIPNGYSRDKHCALTSTIAKDPVQSLRLGKAMACHESNVGEEKACVGWVVNQLGPGNNLGLRLAVIAKDPRFTNLESVGEQHESLEATIPEEGA